MKPVMTLIFVAVLASAANQTGTFTGVITDTMCKKDHAMMKISPDAKCINECVQKFKSKYALFDGANLYPLSDQSKPAPFAGKKVKITGTLYEKTKILTVDSIDVAK